MIINGNLKLLRELDNLENAVIIEYEEIPLGAPGDSRRASLAYLLKRYGTPTILTIHKNLYNGFEMNIGGTTKKLKLEFTGRSTDAFYIVENGKKTFVALFNTTELKPRRVKNTRGTWRDIEGKFDFAVNMDSFDELMQKCGFVGVVDNPEEALKIFDDWCEAENDNAEKYKRAFEFWKGYDYKTIKDFGLYGGKSLQIYDDTILAFVNYWNYKFGFTGEFKVRPDEVKGMMLVESRIGYGDSKEEKRDPMQALLPWDPNCYILARVEGYYGKSEEPFVDGRWPNDNRYPKEGYGAVKKLIIKDTNGNDTFDDTRVTPTMSICFGIRVLINKIQGADDRKTGIQHYNSNDVNVGYAAQIGSKDPMAYYKAVEDILKGPQKWLGN